MAADNPGSDFEEVIRQLLSNYQLDEETLRNTPNRVIRAFLELASGYALTADDAIK